MTTATQLGSEAALAAYTFFALAEARSGWVSKSFEAVPVQPVPVWRMRTRFRIAVGVAALFAGLALPTLAVLGLLAVAALDHWRPREENRCRSACFRRVRSSCARPHPPAVDGALCRLLHIVVAAPVAAAAVLVAVA